MPDGSDIASSHGESNSYIMNDRIIEELKAELSGHLRVGLLGGTFDPIHNGHLFLAASAQSTFALDIVLFITVFEPPHRKCFSSFGDRFAMTKLAVEQNPRFRATNLEKSLPGPSYTVKTLSALRKIAPPDQEFFFILGADYILDINKWWKNEDLLKYTNIILADRPGFERNSEKFGQKLGADKTKGKVLELTMNGPDTSATLIRKRLIEGRPVENLLPTKVIAYIKEKELWRTYHV